MPQKAYSPSSRKKGFTLTELAIVMGITGFVMGAVWVAYQQVQQAKKSNMAVQELQTIVANIRSIYGDLNSFSTASFDRTAAMMNANVFPSEMGGSVSSGTVSVYPSNPWNGGVIILTPPNYPSSLGIGTPNLDQFTVIFASDNPPTSTGDHILPCQQLLMETTNQLKDNGLLAVYDDGDGWQLASAVTPASLGNCAGELGWAFTLHGSSKY